jgi:hypothetical protein
MPRSAWPDLFSLFSQLSFGAPWIAAGLAVLPVLWWLLKVTPPQPRRIAFPPLRLLLGLRNEEQTPAHTPWWLLLLRLAAAALLILALADPLLGRAPQVAGDGPLVLMIDNGWTAAKGWEERQGVIADLLRGAGTRPVAIVTTADIQSKENTPVTLLDAGAAGRQARELQPMPWPGDRMAAAANLARTHFSAAPQIFWLSDGMDDGSGETFQAALARIGSVRIFAPQISALGLLPPVRDGTGFQLTVIRAAGGGGREAIAAAIGRNGETLGDAPLVFKLGEARGQGHVAMPLEIRNQTARLEIRGEDSAGAVQLLDSGGVERKAGIVSAATVENEQPLLSDVYYLQRALTPFAEAQTGTISELIARHVSVLLLADIGKIGGTDADAVNKFVSNGGVLVRFAGPRMAGGSDTLVPVPLRTGGRLLGSAMSWDKPQKLAPFPAASPFNGLVAPEEVTVSQQILAEPSAALSDRSWARLADGTPLVTARQQGQGWIVLFHVTASPAWSSLPLSGLYVDMLKRILALSAGTPAGELARLSSLAPESVLDGMGRTVPAPAELLPIAAKDFAKTEVSAKHPPGLYGAKGVESALNTLTAHDTLLPLNLSGLFNYGEVHTLALQPWLLALGAALLCLDAFIALWLRGYLANLRPAGAARGAALLLLLLLTRSVHADEAMNMQAALDTRLAYVVTGSPDVDAMSKAGLTGLGYALHQRTSYEPVEPVGVDPARDDLTFYPLLYWPMDPREKNLSPAALSKVADYMRLGGTILFDTRDLTLGAARGDNNPGQQALRRLTAGLDMPKLEPVPADHVLTKSFYILRDFPGRWDGGQLWIEALPPEAKNGENGPARGGDGVSPVLIGGNDWAAAWAVDGNGRPLTEPVPGGDAQREMALRFGINLVMYALTGNYKTDQVHAPALLERLGHK